MAGVLQHLRSSTLNKRPNPASMVDGQLAINYASGSPGAFFKDTNGNLVKVGPVHVGATAPNVSPASGGTAGNSLGEQWLDTSGGTYVFKVWDGVAWRSEAGEFVNTTGDTMTGALGVIAGSAGSPSLFFSGDSNTGLFSPGADQIALSAGGTGRLFIESNGRVGIGTGSPNTTLDVRGTIRATDSVNYVDVRGDEGAIELVRTSGAYIDFKDILADDFDARIQQESNGLLFQTGGNGAASERVRITSAGFVGIGNSSPGAKLSIGNGSISLQNSSVAAVSDLGIGFALDANVQGRIYSPVGKSFAIQAGTAGSLTDAVTVDQSGNVGIGLTVPGRKFTASASAGVDTAIQTITSTTGSYIQFTDSTASSYIGTNSGSIVFLNPTTERARIDGDGRLLMGTSARRRVGTPFDPTGGVFYEGSSTSSYEAFTAVVNRTDNVGPVFCFGKSGGNTNGSNTIVANGDQLGVIRFAGADGTDLESIGAEIRAEVDGTPGSNDMPGRLVFCTTLDGFASPAERMRIDNSGRLLVGTTGRSNFFNTGNTAGFQFEGQGGFGAFTRTDNDIFGAGLVFAKTRSSGNTIVQNNDTVGILTFQGSDGSEFVECANIQAFVDGTPGANDMPGRLTFNTTPDGGVIPIERMRITSGGTIRIGQSATDTPGFGNTTTGIGMEPANGALFLSRPDGSNLLFLNSNLSTGTADAINFRRSDVFVGSVTTTTTSTAYNTSSDYRLKENILPVTDGIARLQQLKPSRFNFIADPIKTVDGFLAHEVQSVVPEAITGERDAVDNKGNPQYQGIDQSKMVPLVVAALQECIKKVEALEAKVASLKAGA